MPQVPRVQRQRLDARRISLRHIVGVQGNPGYGQIPAPSIGRPQASVLGRTYYEASTRKALASFRSGSYETKLYEEGRFSVVFPNGLGADRVLHRDRFQIIALGREVPQGGSSIYYTGGQFRPGDEFIEIYEGRNDLLYVGVVTKAIVTPDQIELQGWDPLFLLKLTRETAAGVWSHAPRDVFEHYTQAWTALCADDFSTVTVVGGGFRGPHSGSGLINQQWQGSNYVKLTGEQGMRVFDTGDLHTQTNTNVFLIPLGLAGAEPYTAVRWEATVYRADPTTNSKVTLDFWDGATSVASLTWQFTANPAAGTPQNTATINAAGQTKGVDVPLNKKQVPGDALLAIEVRQRWIFFYVDSVLLGVLPTPTGAYTNVQSRISFAITDATKAGKPDSFALVRNLLLRRTRPFLLRGADKGDYRLPGKPVPGSLLGEYFNEAAVASADVAAADARSRMLAPTGTVAARRQDASISFSAHEASPTWQPPAVVGQNFSARWSGGIYLPLADYDFKLQTFCDDRARVWAGKTRFGEQLTDDWGADHPMALSSQSAGIRSSLGSLTGWYGFLCEYSNSPGGAGISVFYIRQDAGQTSCRVPIGTSAYPHRIAARSPQRYYQLNEGGGSTGVAFDSSTAKAVDGTVNGSKAHRSGPFPGTLAAVFDGSTTYVAGGSVSGIAGGWTLEAWVQPDTVAAGPRTIIRQENVFFLRQNGATFELAGGDGTAFWPAGISGGTATVNAWHYVAGTWDGTTLRLYVNGVEVANSVPGKAAGNAANPLNIGRNGAGTEWFSGAIAHLAIYSAVLSNAIATNYDAGNWYNALRTSGAALPAADPDQPLVAITPVGMEVSKQRYDSHADQLGRLVQTYGLQMRATPMQLESGEFPARVAPRLREGRDTAYVLDRVEGASPQDEITAEETCDILLADGQGLVDDTGAGQVTAELVNYQTVRQHLFAIQQYEQQLDVSIRDMLLERLTTLLTLRGAPWEQITAQPTGKDTPPIDTFPLTGALAAFKWVAGDGLRCRFPQLSLIDQQARQLLGAEWPFTPMGRGQPNVSLKSRPRGVKQAQRDLYRKAMAVRRNPQLQPATITGTLGSVGASTGGVDGTSRAVLPPNLANISRAYLVVLGALSSTWTVQINGQNTGLQVSKPGHYPIGQYLNPGSGPVPSVSAALTGGTGNYQIMLLILAMV